MQFLEKIFEDFLRIAVISGVFGSMPIICADEAVDRWPPNDGISQRQFISGSGQIRAYDKFFNSSPDLVLT